MSMLRHAVVLSALVVLGGVGCRPDVTYQRTVDPSIPDPPPAPNFDTPVNYVAWMMERMAVGHPPEHADAFKDFWQQVDGPETVPKTPPDANAALLKLMKGPPWRDDEYPKLAAFIDSMDPWVEMFRREVKKGGFYFADFGDQDVTNPAKMLLPILRGSRSVSRVLLADAWRGDTLDSSVFSNAIALILEHADQLESTSVSMTRLVGNSIRRATYESIQAAVLRGALTEDATAKILEILGRHDPGAVDLTANMRHEWAACLGVLQALYPGGRLSRDAMREFYGKERGDKSYDSYRKLPSSDSPVSSIKMIDDYFEELYLIAALPNTWEGLKKVRSVDSKMVDNAMSNVFRSPMASTILPSLSRVFEMHAINLAQHKLTLLTLRLGIHKRKNGSWPPSLDDVCKPADLCVDPLTGSSFEYEVSPPSGEFEFRMRTTHGLLVRDGVEVVYPLPDAE